MKYLAIVLSLFLLTGAGCIPLSGNDTGDNSRIIGQSAFPVGSWSLMSVTRSGAAAQDVSDIGATLTLDAGGQLSARICNSMSGEYSINNGKLEAPQVVSTLMFCTGLPGEVEATFTQDLATGFAVSGKGDELILEGDSGTKFTYTRSAEDVGAEQSVSGTITSVDLDAIALDGPAVIHLMTADGNVEIHVPSFGLGLCEAREAMTDVYALKDGEKIEVRGEVSEDGAIVPCSSSDHYLRVVSK